MKKQNKTKMTVDKLKKIIYRSILRNKVPKLEGDSLPLKKYCICGDEILHHHFLCDSCHLKKYGNNSEQHKD